MLTIYTVFASICVFFNYQENHFNGTFPSQAVFNSCVNLVNVSVSYNDFTGPVLEPNTMLPNNLSFLLMAYNQFSGPIPPELGLFNSSFTSVSNLQFLDLFNNSLTGNVPPLPNTTQINLSFNSLNVTKQPGQPGYGLFDCNPQVLSTITTLVIQAQP